MSALHTYPATRILAPEVGTHRETALTAGLALVPLVIHGGDPGNEILPLRDPERFGEVTVSPDLGTVCWPTGADLDPEVLYAAAVHGVDLLADGVAAYLAALIDSSKPVVGLCTRRSVRR